MKEVFGFIRWTWRNFEFWQKAFLLAMFLQGCSITASEPYDFWLRASGVVIILCFFVKWAIWDAIRTSWAKYKIHRNELLTAIKTSDSGK